MSIQQKSALYQLVVTLAAVAAYLIFLATAGPKVALAAFALLAPVGLTPLLFRGEVGDERERHVARRATVLGFGASYLTMVVLCSAFWARQWLAGEGTVDIDVLPLIVEGALVAALLVRALAVLVLVPRAWDLSE